MIIMQTREKLLAELAEAERELGELEEQLREKPDFGLGAGSAGVDSWELTLARKERINEQIAALHEALNKTQEGTYGRCAQCGAKIDPERLEILPTTTLCSSCASKE
jgi:RNA polymerase-binding transcription factor DksA